MCGFCGIYNQATQAPPQEDLLRKMMASMVHRGPDGAGLHIEKEIGLGFRRLSVIDIPGGHQPMSDPDGSVWVVMNGEIYNFHEIRKELESLGRSFRTHSDTEVIVEGYKQWGSDILCRLRGMFGLAIWDRGAETLLLARDHAGMKFVYYSTDGGKLVFGSELKPLLIAEQSLGEVDPRSLGLFFRYGYTPSPFTVVKGVQKLAPGTMLVAKRGSVTVRRWYAYRPEPFQPELPYAAAVEELGRLYRAAVRRHLVSDVNLGLLLSGGVDSALLLALMNEHGCMRDTFTIGYGDDYSDDELREADRTSHLLGSHHHSMVISQRDFEESLPIVVGFLEEPICSPSIVPMFHISRLAREHVKVALVGQGPDELFGGYRRHLGVRYGQPVRRLPRLAHAGLEKVFHHSRSEAIQRGIHSLWVHDRIARYQSVFSLLPGDEVDSLFVEGLLPPRWGEAIRESWAELEPLLELTDELGGFQYLELQSSLPDELLMYTDKLSMAHGLEVRVPYLDREIVEFAERLPADMKVRNFRGKRIHYSVCDEVLPREIVRRRKRNFAADVVDSWFRKALRGKFVDYILDDGSLMYEYLNRKVVQSLLKDHRSGKRDVHKMLFSVVLFEEWLRQRHHSVA